MGTIATAVRHLIAAGVDGDALVVAIEEMEEAPSRSEAPSAGAMRMRRYRERRNMAEGEWEELADEIKRRDNYTCQYCGIDSGTMCVDHVVPLKQGGTNDPSNLKTACKPCNSGKSGRSLYEWRHQCQ